MQVRTIANEALYLPFLDSARPPLRPTWISPALFQDAVQALVRCEQAGPLMTEHGRIELQMGSKFSGVNPRGTLFLCGDTYIHDGERSRQVFGCRVTVSLIPASGPASGYTLEGLCN